MELAIIVYLIGVLPSIKVLLSATSILCVVVLLIMAIGAKTDIDVYGTDREQGKKGSATLSKLYRKVWIPCVIFPVACLIPSEKTMYTMIAAYAGQRIAETPEAKQIANDGVDVLKELLAKAKKELAEENKSTK